ncbi:MAG: hypothetical protein RI894_514 [Bacteroidota bacterium]|jgi:bifunctional DNase/RNase
MKKIELDVVTLTHSTVSNHNYAVVLGEHYGARRLPIVIGGFEAQAIAVTLERMYPPRPLTHDLLKNTIEQLGATLKEVIINDFQEGVFFAQLICLLHGEAIEIDSRASDAIALAVRFECKIYTYEFILEAAGIVIESEMAEVEKTKDSKNPASSPATYSRYNIEELKRMMQESLENEDYEQAARIRDELGKRNA